MSLTIQYHNPERPAKASMTLITGQPKAAVTMA
jgi:hypothetical protein